VFGVAKFPDAMIRGLLGRFARTDFNCSALMIRIYAL